MKAIPGDPFMGEKKPSPEILARLMEQYDLDKPVFQQYTKYLGNIVQGDFGLSMKKQGQSVTDIIVDTFGPSLRLGLIAIVVSVIVGVLLGMLAALYHRKLIDNTCVIVAIRSRRESGHFQCYGL
jgi:oligopeptide transport system permease protein